jgi:hypothetical protein
VTPRLRGAQRLGCSTAANTAAKAIASYRREATRLEHRPSRRPPLDGPGQSAHSYGSEGAAPHVVQMIPASLAGCGACIIRCSPPVSMFSISQIAACSSEGGVNR